MRGVSTGAADGLSTDERGGTGDSIARTDAGCDAGGSGIGGTTAQPATGARSTAQSESGFMEIAPFVR